MTSASGTTSRYRSEHGDAGLEARLALDRAGKDVTDAALGEPHVPKCILLRLAAELAVELGYASPLRNDDDAEQLAFAAPAIKVRDHIGKRQLELRDDDQVGAARHPAEQCHPPRVAAHYLDDHDAVMRRSSRVQAVERLGHDANRRVEADAELRY